MKEDILIIIFGKIIKKKTITNRLRGIFSINNIILSRISIKKL